MANSDLGIGVKKYVKVLVDDQLVQKFAEMSGDHNPIHLDEEYAKTTKFGRRIAHGMILGALISRSLSTEFGMGGVYLGQTLKFVAPVFIGDSVTIELHIKAGREEKGILFVETTVTKDSGEKVAEGMATIMVPSAVRDS